MTNELRVFYKSEKGLMTFLNKKTIFQHNEDRENVDIGLGILKEGTLTDKGNYGFAVFENVNTVIPENYCNISFFHNRGVPVKIEKGMYGKNILLKESYKDRTYIRGYKEDGSIGLYESATIHNEKYTGINVYYNRLDDLVSNWVDITESVITEILKTVKNLKCDVKLANEFVLGALKCLSDNKIYKLDSGVFVGDGKFESLLIWNENSEVKMTWLGRKLNLDMYKYKEISEDLREILELTEIIENNK